MEIKLSPFISMHNASVSTSHRFSFHGSGGELFGQFLVNWLLTIVTLGIYYPWAKASLNRYYYRNTEFSGHRFWYHGTGTEMFFGFIKTVLILAAVGVTAFLLGMAAGRVAGFIAFYLMLIGLIPFAMVGALQYTCNRSSWRNVHFSYFGTAGSMATIYFPGLILTIITLGLYSPWLMASLERETTGNTRFGNNVEFEYHGNGGALFKRSLWVICFPSSRLVFILSGWLLTCSITVTTIPTFTRMAVTRSFRQR